VKTLPHFVKLPTAWIDQGGLKAFKWGECGGDEIAALALLTVIAHHIDKDTGVARLSYDILMEKTSLSRAKVAAGLKILIARGIVEPSVDGRGSYRLAGYNPAAGWAMFPARGLYRNEVVEAFTELRLRRRAELDALKLYFLFAARRDNKLHLAKIGYERIAESSGVGTNYIRTAISVLAANHLVHVIHLPSSESGAGVVNGYRLAHLPTRALSVTAGTPIEGGVEIVSL
jgi:hypothetical protein